VKAEESALLSPPKHDGGEMIRSLCPFIGIFLNPEKNFGGEWHLMFIFL
jgi:hypothetical protein